MTAPVLLDGGTATELQRRGIAVRGPWWTSGALRTAHGRATLAAIHADYVAAGARIITADTFRCHRRTLTRAGLDDRAATAMVTTAVGLARAAAREDPAVRVAGSVAPVEDCYRPDLVPPTRVLRAEHGWLARTLVAAGVDLLLLETMNTVREARAALAAALDAGVPVLVSFVAGDGGRLLSGEPLGPAARSVSRDGASAVLVNCSSMERTGVALAEMSGAGCGPVGAYPNVEDRRGIAPATHVDRHVPVACGPRQYADAVAGWCRRYGLALVGGCCGTTPAHLTALAGLTPRPAAR